MSDVENGDWPRLELFTGFNKLAFHRRDSSFECFNWSTQNYGLCRCEKLFLSLVSLTMLKNERRGVNVPWLSQGWHRSVCFSKKILFHLLFYTSLQVVHLYACLQDCDNSSVVTCHQNIHQPISKHTWEEFYLDGILLGPIYAGPGIGMSHGPGTPICVML